MNDQNRHIRDRNSTGHDAGQTDVADEGRQDSVKEFGKPGIRRQGLLPGFEEGRYEPRRQYDRGLFGAHSTDVMKRDNRINIRVSGQDLEALQGEALKRGIPLQSLLAGIIHDHVDAKLASEGEKAVTEADDSDESVVAGGPFTRPATAKTDEQSDPTLRARRLRN